MEGDNYSVLLRTDNVTNDKLANLSLLNCKDIEVSNMHFKLFTFPMTVYSDYSLNNIAMLICRVKSYEIETFGYTIENERVDFLADYRQALFEVKHFERCVYANSERVLNHISKVFNISREDSVLLIKGI